MILKTNFPSTANISAVTSPFRLLLTPLNQAAVEGPPCCKDEYEPGACSGDDAKAKVFP